jgi:hypothetical protein
MKNFFIILLLCMVVLVTTGFAQTPAIGDWGSKATGSWTVATTWAKYTATGWDGPNTVSAPTSTDNVWIRGGFTVTVSTSGKTLKNLYIESGSTLVGDSPNPTSNQRYMRVYGNTIQNNGYMGVTAAAPTTYTGLCVENWFVGTTTWSGSGVTKVSRIRPGLAGTTLVIDQDMTWTYFGSTDPIGTGSGAGWFPNAFAPSTLIINTGKTVTGVDGAGLYMASSSSADGPAGTVTVQVDGNLYLDGTQNLVTLRPATGQTVNFIVNGNVRVARSFYPTGTTGVTSTITVNSGGSLRVGTGLALGSIYFNTPTQTVTGLGTFEFACGTMQIGATAGLDPTNGPIRTATRIFASRGKYEYIGTAPQVTGPELPTTVGLIRSNNATGVTLSQSTRLDSGVSCTVGVIYLGSNNLTLSSSATTTTNSATSYVDVSGSGVFKREIAADGSYTFPVGNGAASPVSLTFTGAGYSSASVDLDVFNTKHSLNTSTTDYLNRYWNVNATGITGGSYDANFVYADADFVGTETNLTLGKYDGIQWNVVGTVNATTNTLSATGLTSFSDFTGGEASALPIQLASFVGSYVGNSAKLEWSTISEVNNYGFNVQRQSGNEYVTIGFVAGKGTTLEPQSYSFVDAQPGTSYRLEQVDNNGLKNYFGPVYLNPNSVDDKTVPAVFALNQNYPNPFNPTTNITFSLAKSGQTTLKVYNILGNEVATLFNGNAEAGKLYNVKFDATKLSTGMYIYKLQNGNSVEVRKLTLVK